MLFSEEDAPLLKKWIVKRLENTSDADADVLADYVLALLRHDGDEQTVRQLCETEIPDFLKEDSNIFVQDVFDAIHYKSYMPGYTPLPRPSIPFAPPSGPSAGYAGMRGVAAPLGPQNGSRKRSFSGMDDTNSHVTGNDSNGRTYKQPRRGGMAMGRGSFENSGQGGGRGGRIPPMNMSNMPLYPNLSGPNLPVGLDTNMVMGGMPSPPLLPPLDPNNPLAALLAMQAMGIPMPNLGGIPPVGSTGFARPKKQRCLDYDQKGFCAKGNTCQFEHGEHSIWVPPAKRQDEYDPTNSGLLAGPATGRGGFNQSRGGDRGRGRGMQSNGGHFSGPNRRGGRSEFSSDRPNFDKNNTTIVVENIPEEKFSEDEVRKFFAEFGTVVEVDMRPYKRLAIVKYDDWGSAKAAYNSPKVIFDNRFVKVYWFTSPDALPQPPPGAANDNAKNRPTLVGPTQVSAEPEIDMEELKRKQEEAQKVHEEKIKRQQEMEASRKELEKRQEELVKRRDEQQRILAAKIAAKRATSSPLKQENGSPAPESKPSQTDLLKAQLAALEAEAQVLGIDPNFSEEQAWAPRGRGRGRGGYRGRGAYVPRGARAGYRGRGSAPFVPGGRSFNLDNRPKKVGVTGIDFTNPEKDESLREFLLGIGDFSEIETTPDQTNITFKDRFTAEKFMNTPNSSIPSLGRVEMVWIATPLPPINLPSTNSLTNSKSNFNNKSSSHTPQNGENRDADTQMEEEGDAMMESATPTRHGNVGGGGGGGGTEQQQQQQENLDYDVADENDWGPE